LGQLQGQDGRYEARPAKSHGAGRSLQKELAHKIGTSHSAVSRLESGQATVSLKTMKRVAEALGGRLLVGFEIESGNHEVVRDLVAV
jgi:transcriptional regulator with XRE-family HTH domain